MKIAIHRSPGGISFGTDALYKWGFEQLGHTVGYYDFPRQARKALPMLESLKVDVICVEVCRVMDKGLNSSVFYQGLTQLAQKGCKVIVMVLDNPKVWGKIKSTMASYYKGFIWDHTPQLKDSYKGHVYYAPLIQEHFCYGKLEEAEKKFDVAFAGGLYPFRRTFLKEVWGRLDPKVNFRLLSAVPKQVRSGREFDIGVLEKYKENLSMGLMDHESLNLAYNQSKILLCYGIYADIQESRIFYSRDNGSKNQCWSYPCRLFSMAATGSLVLADWRKGVSDCFDTGKEIETYESLEELIEKIEYYLSHEKEREEIAGRGRQRYLKDHTIEKRLSKVLGACSEFYAKGI